MVFAHVQSQGPADAERLEDGRPTSVHELDSRTGDGIEVRLLWHPGDNRVSVSVNDTKTGDSFEVQVRSGDRALDVFQHPYAYAALPAAPPSVDSGVVGPTAE